MSQVAPRADSALPTEAADVYRNRLARTLPEVRSRIEAALARAGRPAGAVRLVGVTKGHPDAVLAAALEAGLRDLGENRPELLVERRALHPEADVTWHLIGHVQRRKAADAIASADLFHALDSPRLAERLERLLEARGGARLKALVQVNTSGEGSKGGFSLEEVVEQLDALSASAWIDVRGLMTMAPFVDDEGLVRTTFARLRDVHERALRATGYTGTELSMGMTNDFEWAIAEGSTLVRIGTALFGSRPAPPTHT